MDSRERLAAEFESPPAEIQICGGRDRHVRPSVPESSIPIKFRVDRISCTRLHRYHILWSTEYWIAHGEPLELEPWSVKVSVTVARLNKQANEWEGTASEQCVEV